MTLNLHSSSHNHSWGIRHNWYWIYPEIHLVICSICTVITLVCLPLFLFFWFLTLHSVLNRLPYTKHFHCDNEHNTQLFPLDCRIQVRRINVSQTSKEFCVCLFNFFNFPFFWGVGGAKVKRFEEDLKRLHKQYKQEIAQFLSTWISCYL